MKTLENKKQITINYSDIRKFIKLPENYNFILGDGRSELKKETEKTYDVITITVVEVKEE